ncbi:MAG: ASCH domain-containing protein [Patescibacteria group bacterium]
MKKEWKLIPRILDGTKTVESRWYKSKIIPWDKIKSGDTLYFKDSGGPVFVQANVTKVDQYEVEDNIEAASIMQRYLWEDLGTLELPEAVENYIKNKRYAVFVHFNKIKRISPFEIDKSGFGMQCAWILVPTIKGIVKKQTGRSG